MTINSKKAKFLTAATLAGVSLFAIFQNFIVVTDPDLNDQAYISQVINVPFECGVENDDKGCQQRVTCPQGFRPRTAKMICNLEYNTLDTTVLNSVRDGYIKVVKRSGGDAANGKCAINDSVVSSGSSLVGELPYQYPYITASCSEADAKSGGDCRIAGNLQCEKYNGALYSHKIKLNLDRVVQGMWKFDDGTWLVTQDQDGRNKSEQVRFSLTDANGKVLKQWILNYGTHGQSIYVRKASNGFDVFTEAKNANGVAQFFLSTNKKDLKFVKEIIPTQNPAAPVTIGIFGADPKNDKVVAFYKDDSGKKMWVLKLSSLLNGQLEILNQFQAKGAFGAIQGVGLLNDSIYLLAGDGAINNDKSVFRFSLDGKEAIVRYEIRVGRGVGKVEGNKNEPEGLHVTESGVYFSMVTAETMRVYSMSPLFFKN